MSRLAPLDKALVLILVPLWAVVFVLAVRTQTETSGIVFIGLLYLASQIMALPFEWYSTFVIEERFGFNRTTLRTFFIDRVKGLGLAILLGTPLLAGILALFEFVGMTIQSRKKSNAFSASIGERLQVIVYDSRSASSASI